MNQPIMDDVKSAPTPRLCREVSGPNMTTLGMLLWDKVSLDVDMVLQIFIGVCQLLRETHDLGYAVGALHPEGIVIVRTGETLNSVHIKKSGAVCGIAYTDEISLPFEKTCYLSPEQLDGLSPSPRSDIYAIGSMMFTALVGTPPLNNKNNKNLRLLVKKTKQTESHYERKIEYLETVIQRCLMNEEKKRYRSVADLEIELTNILYNKAPSKTGSNRNVVPRRAVKTALAGLAVSVLTIFCLASYNAMQGTPEQLTEPVIESVWNKKANQYEHGDPFAMVIRANQECYAYVIYVNDRDSAISLYPSKSQDNKLLEPGQYVILDTLNNSTMHVDETKGLFILVSITAKGRSVMSTLLSDSDFSKDVPVDHCLNISGSELFKRLNSAKSDYPELIDFRIENAPRAKQPTEEERKEKLRFGRPDRIEITLSE